MKWSIGMVFLKPVFALNKQYTILSFFINQLSGFTKKKKCFFQSRKLLN